MQWRTFPPSLVFYLGCPLSEWCKLWRGFQPKSLVQFQTVKRELCLPSISHTFSPFLFSLQSSFLFLVHIFLFSQRNCRLDLILSLRCQFLSNPDCDDLKRILLKITDKKILRNITMDYPCDCLWASIYIVYKEAEQFISCLCFFAFNYLPVLCAVGKYGCNSFYRLFSPLSFIVLLSFPVCVWKQACPLPAFSLGRLSLEHLKVTVGSCADENCNLQIFSNNESGQKMRAVWK